MVVLGEERVTLRLYWEGLRLELGGLGEFSWECACSGHWHGLFPWCFVIWGVGQGGEWEETHMDTDTEKEEERQGERGSR